ncbi:MAG: hypothetical protein ACI4NJ_09875 [Cellvibrio sp.]
MNDKPLTKPIIRPRHLILGVVTIVLVLGFSLQLKHQPIDTHFDGGRYLAQQEIVDSEGTIINAEYQLDISDDNFRWLIKGEGLQVLSQGVAHHHNKTLRLEILSGEFSGDIQKYNQDILFQWLKTKTTGQEVLLALEESCWRIDGMLILLCPDSNN